MTIKLKAYLLRLATESRARESFKEDPIGAMKRARLKDSDIVFVLSGKVQADDKNSIPVSLNIAVKTNPKIS